MYDFKTRTVPDPFREACPRGSRTISVTCKLGPACDNWAIAMEQLAKHLSLPHQIELPPSLELQFRVRYRLRDAATVRDAFARLAGKFGVHLNIYYSGGQPWGMDVSTQPYFRD